MPIAAVLTSIITTAVFGKKTEGNEILTESEGGNKTFIPYMRDPFQITIQAGIGINWYQWHFTGGIQLDYQPNPFPGAYYGFKYNNLSINVFALYKLWWLYLGPGVSFLVQHMEL